MQEIYDSGGTVVGWLDGDYILDHASVSWIGFLHGELIYLGGSRPLGFFSAGVFRDLRGNAIAFVRGAKAGQVLPDLKAATAPVPPAKIRRPVAPSVPERPVNKIGWGRSWKEFFDL
jgi:hypothetical protein